MTRFTHYIFLIISMGILASCDNFERKFYKRLDEVRFNAANNRSDTFDLATITDFTWDSVILLTGNESVPVFKEQVEEILNNRTSAIDWEDRRFNHQIDTTFKYTTEDIPVDHSVFYFLTPDKKIVAKKIDGNNNYRSFFSIEHCLLDSTNERLWLSREECKFVAKTNSKNPKEATVFLFPPCNTKLQQENIFPR